MTTMITIAQALLVLAGCLFLIRLLRGPSLADRVVALDALVVTIVAGTLLHAVRTGSTRFVDLALVLGFVGFVGASASARFIERRGG